MHIPDGYLGPITYGGLWAAMVPIWGYASRQVRKTLKATQVPLLALSAAFSFVIMMFNIPIPAGTTGHATGATLIAILIGPWAGIIAVSIALVIQALVFGDGGITAIGANCFNMAFAEILIGYAIFRLIAGRQKDATNMQGKRFLIGAAVGSYAGINLAAFLTAFELGVQTILHVGRDGRPLYSPFPLKLTVPAIMVEHLLLFGVVEAIVTVLVLIYLQKSYPDLLRRPL